MPSSHQGYPPCRCRERNQNNTTCQSYYQARNISILGQLPWLLSQHIHETCVGVPIMECVGRPQSFRFRCETLFCKRGVFVRIHLAFFLCVPFCVLIFVQPHTLKITVWTLSTFDMENRKNANF